MSTPPAHSYDAKNLPDAVQALGWQDAARAAHFANWLSALTPTHGLAPLSVRAASADASFRRYFRIDAGTRTMVIMDAPPDKENNQAFVDKAGLFEQAGVHVPKVLNWDQTHGFLLLEDLGSHTLMQSLDRLSDRERLHWFDQATDILCQWQQSSREGVLPAYDAPTLHQELMLFPTWYVRQYKNLTLSARDADQLQNLFDTLVAFNLAAPKVFVHRDFMPRNLMMPSPDAPQVLGVLDFQDALHGPITYDIASLMRDAFVSWDEDFCLDITVRYWEKARQAGLMDFEDWHSDFGSFYRAVEWMGLQRHLKVAGIFARLTLRDGKPQYLADTPRFIGYMRATATRYRELFPLLKLLDHIEGTQNRFGYALGRS